MTGVRSRLHPCSAAAVILVATLLGTACGEGTGTGTGRIGGAEAKELVGAGAVLVDVRSAREYRGGHLPDAVHVPVSELAARLDELPRDQPLIVYCLSGVRSSRAAEILRNEGFDVRDLGGIDAWPGR